ncbi:MAG: helix-turn-helix transcriptional regulator [Dehalococcoidia bacterium]|nr:helix-turn-helix transcriptional regulator [Dehalococcoidia bacterium]
MAQRGRPPHPGSLTPAEARVLEHVREGRQNAEIAVRLGISVNTVRYHVSVLLPSPSLYTALHLDRAS